MQQQVEGREQLMNQLKICEKSLQDCSIHSFSELRFRYKQLKEKIRSIDYFEKLKSR